MVTSITRRRTAFSVYSTHRLPIVIQKWTIETTIPKKLDASDVSLLSSVRVKVCFLQIFQASLHSNCNLLIPWLLYQVDVLPLVCSYIEKTSNATRPSAV